MDKNLRDRVDTVIEKNIIYKSEGWDKLATALCSMIVDECRKARIDELKEFTEDANYEGCEKGEKFFDYLTVKHASIRITKLQS